MIFGFTRYYKGDYSSRLEKSLGSMYGAKRVYLFSNARSAEYLFLKALDLPLDTEVAIQAFTCNAVVNPILWLKHTPLYIDISPKSFGMDFKSLKERVSTRTKVLIAQHTFGIGGLSDEMLKFAKSKGIYVLEDCAHSLGNNKQGSKGDAAIISFGIEKILSTRVGGALIVNNPELIPMLDREYSKIRNLGIIDTFLWLLNPVVWRGLRSLRGLQTGVSLFLNSLGLLNMGFYRSELRGIKPSGYPRKLPNVLSHVILDQMKDLEENLSHREYINDIYASALSVPHLRGVSTVRFPLVIDDYQVLNKVQKALDKANVYYGNWYNPLVYPASTNIEAMGYRWSECPTAEEISRHIINLPTGLSISKAQAFDISNLVKKILNEK